MNISGTMIGSLGVAALAVMMAVYHRGYDRGMSDAPERVRQDRIETERWADELAVDAAWQASLPKNLDEFCVEFVEMARPLILQEAQERAESWDQAPSDNSISATP